jgi:hypothetical protein
LIENLYHYLWSKDSLFNQSPQVNIPDTIVYRYEQPAFWYFTSRAKPAIAKTSSPRSPKNGPDGTQIMDLGELLPTRIMRKAQKNLNNKEIEKVFLRKLSPSGIVAVFMYRKCEKNIVNVMKMHEKTLDDTSNAINQQATGASESPIKQNEINDDAAYYDEGASENGKDLISNIHDKAFMGNK